MTYAAVESEVLAILKTIPTFQDNYSTDTLSFDAASKKFLDSDNALAWVRTGDAITVTGSASNDGTYTAVSSAAGFVEVAQDVIDELAGASITLTRPATAAVGDYRLLDRGYQEIAVLNPGTFSDETSEWALTNPSPLRSWLWDVLVELFERHSPDEPTVTAAFSALRDSVITALVKAPNLDGSTLRVQLVSVSSDGDPLDRGATASGPFFKSQILRVKIRELDSNTAGNA